VKRLALGLISATFLLLGVLVAVVGLVLGTESGTVWLLGQVQSLAPGMVSVQRSQGHFFGRLELHDIGLNMETMQISADNLVLDWSPRRLLLGEFMVNELSLAVLRFAGEPAQDEPPPEPLQWPIELPAISPPLRLVLARVELNGAQIITAPEAAPLVVDHALLRGHWGDDGIVLETLQSNGPVYTVSIEGQVDPMNVYALQLENRLSLSMDGRPSVDVQGSIEGNAERLEMRQHVSGGVSLGLNASLDKPLERPAWQALLQVQSLSGELLSADLPLTLGGELSASGDLTTAAVSGKLASASDTVEWDQLQLVLDLAADWSQQRLLLTQLDLTQQGQPLRVSLQGQASREALDIQGDWAAIQWPLVVVTPMLRSERGELSLRGPLDDYQLAFSADLVGQHIPQGEWRLTGKGDQQQLLVEQLNGQLLGGELNIEGDVAWSPEVTWDLAARARDIQPGSILADPSAIVQLAVTTSGVVADTGPQAEVILQRLGGSLNGQPLTGNGELSYSAQRIEIKRLKIKNADAALVADGVIGAQSDLQWQLLIPNLGKLLADAAGSVASTGRLSGPQETPHIVGDIKVDSVALSGARIDSLKADIDLDLQDRRRSHVVVSAAALAYGENVLDQLQLELDGFIHQHRLTLDASQPQAAVELAAQGGYDQLWLGKLMRLELDTQALGPWHLQQPAALSLGAASARAELLCLIREGARLCAEGDWQADGEAHASVDLAALPVAWFKAFLPEQFNAVTGMLSASGKISQADTLQAQVQAALTPGELVLVGAAEDVRVPHSGARLVLNAKEAGANVSLQTGIGSSRLQAEFSSPDVLAVDDKQRANIAATLRLEAPDLDILPLLVPTVSRVEGEIKAAFDVEGELGKPWLSGGGQLRLSRLNLDQVGLALSDTEVDLGVSNNTLTVDGRLSSGGELNLQGGLLLDAEKGWPFTLGVTGEDFIALNLPNLQVLISPDLTLQRSAGAVALNGTLTIPSAEILVRDLPSGSRSASRDVVIVHKNAVVTPVQEETTPVTTDITVALGDKVHLAALGLDAFVRGELALRGLPGRPLRATGDLRMDDGIFRAYGQRLEIERGLFSYAKSPLDNPGVNVRAVRSIGDVEVGVNALGTARETTVTTFSSPAMSENDRISYLVTGKPAREGASLSLDRQVAKNLTVGVSVDTHTGERAFLSRYRLHRTLHTEVSSSARSSALDLFYTVERK
jgi:translocation and assembly module TamB